MRAQVATGSGRGGAEPARGLGVCMAAPITHRPARRLRGLGSARVLGRRVPVARRPLNRLLGLALLRRESAGPGLLLPGCRSIHTLGMRFPLDVVFLDGEGRPLRVEPAVPPGRFLAESRAEAVLEVPTALLPGPRRSDARPIPSE